MDFFVLELYDTLVHLMNNTGRCVENYYRNISNLNLYKLFIPHHYSDFYFSDFYVLLVTAL